MRWLVSLLVVAVAAALMGTVSVQSMLVEECQPPDPHSYCNGNCAPENRLIGNTGDTCRTNFRFRNDHNLPPEWVLMFDSYDYNTLVGSALLSREFDNDGDVSVSV